MARCRKEPVCPKCGGVAHKIDLETRPKVWACNDCSEWFTCRGRVAMTKLRAIRKKLIQRWDQLADDLWQLEQEIRDAPNGVFTESERDDALYELSQTVWDAMVNHRPRLPASVYGPRRGVVERYRAAVLDFSIFRSSPPERRMALFGDITEEQLRDRIRVARENGGDL